MTIKFLGHACFLVVGSGGVRLIVDPYEPGGFGGAIGYGRITEAADIVLVTHEHADHNFVTGVPGNPTVCRHSCQERGISFRVVEAAHDEAGGSKRGMVRIFTFELDGIRVCHVGDLGQALTAGQVAQIGPVDVLMVPVGGTYTLDAQGAWAVVQQLAPRLVIPMHYKTAKIGLPLGTLEGFTAGKPHVSRAGGSTLELSAADLPSDTRIIVLEPAN